MPKGPRGERRPADLNKRAFDIVRIASGEKDDAPKAAGPSKAGKAGGDARAKRMSSDERQRIAKMAAKARWGKTD
jgi:hypothetical protein